MLADEVLILIYRALRDSVNSNISEVSYDESRKIISLKTKGDIVPYPYTELNKGCTPSSFCGKWEVDKSGIRNLEGGSAPVVSSKTWREKILCLIWKR